VLRHHVRRNGVVALPPANHHRQSADRRGAVFHILSAEKIEPAVINGVAWPLRSDLLVYPADRPATA
jgi:hypothetical protein